MKLSAVLIDSWYAICLICEEDVLDFSRSFIPVLLSAASTCLILPSRARIICVA